MKLTKFIVLDKDGFFVAPNTFLFNVLSEELFKRDMQDAVRYYKHLKEKGIDYTPETFTLYKLTKVKEFKL